MGILNILENSKREFKKETRRVAIKGFPNGTKKVEIQELLDSYNTETIHTDKSGESCKVVFADKNEASKCIDEIRIRGEKRRWKLEPKYTASDFMICVSHFPLAWDEEEFKKLIEKFGETEKCFLVRSEFLNQQSMGYGFLEFTAKASAIKARNELHGHIVKQECHGCTQEYRIQVHWISQIPDNYGDLQSCTVYCHLGDSLDGHSREEAERLQEHMEAKFDSVYFNIASLEKENFAIAEFETHEFAAETVLYLYNTPFRWRNYDRGYRPPPLQVSFSIPDYQGKVLLKSFEIFFKEFIMKRQLNDGGLLPKPPTPSSLSSSRSFSTDSSSFTTPSDLELFKHQLLQRNVGLTPLPEQSRVSRTCSLPPYYCQTNGGMFEANNNNLPMVQQMVPKKFPLNSAMHHKLDLLSDQTLKSNKFNNFRNLAANLFPPQEINKKMEMIQNIKYRSEQERSNEQLRYEHRQFHERIGQFHEQRKLLDDRIYERKSPNPVSTQYQDWPLHHPHQHQQFRDSNQFNGTPPRNPFADDTVMDSPKSRHLLGSQLVNSLVDSTPPQRESWPSQAFLSPASCARLRGLDLNLSSGTPEHAHRMTEMNSDRKRRILHQLSEQSKRPMYSYENANQNEFMGQRVHREQMNRQSMMSMNGQMDMNRVRHASHCSDPRSEPRFMHY